MNTCPGCHKALPTADNPNQLCSDCARALVAGQDEFSSAASPQSPRAHDGPAKKRPLVITILALQDFLSAAVALLVGIILLASARLAAFLTTLSKRPVIPDSLPFDMRLKYALVCLFCGCLIYLLAMGLWRLKNWARRVIIAIFMLDVMFGGSFSLLWPLQTIFEADPVLQILARMLTFSMVCYLFTRSIKTAFGVVNPRRWWLYTSAILALFSLASALYNSKTEFQAWRWHRQHGNQVQFEGITFPVYKWYAPHISEVGFRIDDEPGPLRPNERLAFITIESCREDCTLTPRQLAEKRYQSYKNAHYTDVKFVQRQIKGETLECVDEAMFARTIDCYGRGPIGHVFFAGNERSYEQLNRMLTEAR